MSGGAFDYNQYRIDDIIERIEREIHDATKPRPATYNVQYVSVWEIVDEHCSRGLIDHPFRELKTLDEVRKAMKTLPWKVEIIEDKGDKIIFTEGGKTLYVYDGEYDEYPAEYDKDGFKVYPYYPDYTEETINEFKKGVEILKMARIYAQRIDWLICGDDGEESFHERLAEDLADITYEQIEKDIQEQINYLTNNED